MSERVVAWTLGLAGVAGVVAALVARARAADARGAAPPVAPPAAPGAPPAPPVSSTTATWRLVPHQDRAAIARIVVSATPRAADQAAMIATAQDQLRVLGYNVGARGVLDTPTAASLGRFRDENPTRVAADGTLLDVIIALDNERRGPSPGEPTNPVLDRRMSPRLCMMRCVATGCQCRMSQGDQPCPGDRSDRYVRRWGRGRNA